MLLRSALVTAIDKVIMASLLVIIIQLEWGQFAPVLIIFSIQYRDLDTISVVIYQSLTRSCLEINVLFDRPLAHWRLLFFWS